MNKYLINLIKKRKTADYNPEARKISLCFRIFAVSPPLKNTGEVL